jgi:hypothetical protein
MTKEEAEKFVSDAVDHVELTYQDKKSELPKQRAKLASFLREVFRISIKELNLNMKDGDPYILFEYVDEKNEVAESTINIKKWESNLV